MSTSGSLLRALRGLRGFRAGLTANWYQPTNLPDQPTELFAHIREHNLWQGVLAYQHKDGSHFVGTDLRRSSLVVHPISAPTAPGQVAGATNLSLPQPQLAAPS